MESEKNQQQRKQKQPAQRGDSLLKAEAWLNGEEKNDAAVECHVNTIMTWKSKRPPIYVWDKDLWYNEFDGKTYTADVIKAVWRCGEELIPFPPKCKIMKKRTR